MQKFKEAFLDLLHKDKKRLVLLIVNVSIFFIAFLGLVLPFMVGSIINNNHVSMAQVAGGTFYTILFVVLMFLYAYMFIMKKDDIARKVFFGSTILLTLVYFYGVLLHRVGAPTAGTGFGAWLMLLMLIAMYFMIFGSKYALKYIDKLVKTPEEPVVEEAVVEEPVVEEPVVEEPVVEEPVVEEPVVEEPVVEEPVVEEPVIEKPVVETSEVKETVESPKQDKEKE